MPEVVKHLSLNVVLLHNSPLLEVVDYFTLSKNLLRLGFAVFCTGVHCILINQNIFHLNTQLWAVTWCV